MASDAVPHDAVAVESPPQPSRIGRNVAALASGQLVTWTATLGWTLVVPRVLGPAGMGLIVSAWAVTGVLAVVLGLGTKNFLVRALVVDRGGTARLVGTATVLRLLLSPLFVVAIVVYARVAGFGGDGTLVLYLAAGATMLTLLAEPMQAVFQAAERMEYLAYADVINRAAQSALGILLAVMGFGVVGVVGSWMVVSGVVFVLNAVWVRRWAPLSLATSRTELRTMVRESVAYWAFGVFFMIYLWIDSLMLSLMTAPEVVGWYGVPMKLFQTFMFLPVLVSTAWLPRFVSAFEADPNSLRRVAARPVGLVLAMALPIAAGIAIGARPAIDVLYGSAYAEAVPVLVLLGMCVPPMYLNILLSQVLVAAERQIAWTWAMAGATVANPLLNLALIPLAQDRFGNGAIGAAVSLLLTELLVVGAGLAMVGRGVLDRDGLRRCGRVAVATGAACGAALLLRPLDAGVSEAAAAVVFVALAALLRIATPEEVAYVRAKLRRRRPPAAPGSAAG